MMAQSALAMGKHGRPRRSNVDRYRCGRIREVPETPAPGVERLRVFLLETATAIRDARASHILGICHARGLITDAELDAGLVYWRLFHFVDHRPGVRGCLTSLQPSGLGSINLGELNYDIRRAAAYESLYLTCRQALSEAGARVDDTVEAVLFGVMPRFLDVARHQATTALDANGELVIGNSEAWHEDLCALSRLRAGLMALVEILRRTPLRAFRIDYDARARADTLEQSVIGYLMRRAARLQREAAEAQARKDTEAQAPRRRRRRKR